MHTPLTVKPPRSLTALLASVLACALSLPAAAQEPTSNDLRALRYYVEQGNDGAVESELRRLRDAFPGWTPPDTLDTLFAADVPPRLDRIYDLIAQGAHAEARALIAETDAAFDTWSPPEDMLSLLRLSEAQQNFDDAVQSGEPERVIAVARGVPGLVSCERINNAWELAEAHLARGETAETLAVYRGVVQACNDPDILVATLEKANAVAPLETLSALSDEAQSGAPGAADRLRATEDRLRQGRGAAPRGDAGGALVAQPSAQRPEPAVPATRPTARPAGGPAPASAPAQPTASPPPAPSAPGGLSAVRAAAEAGDWARCHALSLRSDHPEAIYQRGWCAYNLDRPVEAITAFRTAIVQLRDATQKRDAGYGLLLSMLSLGMTEQAAQFAAAAPMTRTQRITIEAQIIDQRGVRAFEAGNHARAVAFFRAHRQLTGITRRDLAMLEGYALVNMGDRAAARALFEALHRDLATPETRRALRDLR